MPLVLPPGKRLAVNISVDFDAQTAFSGHLAHLSPSILSRGDFDVEVGTPRILKLLARYGIPSTWCTPSHTLMTFPNSVKAIVDGGHEIAAHGVYHESIPSLDANEERRLMELQLRHHEQIVGSTPRGYRSPAWDFSDTTMSLLDEFGFDWDSSLMGRDFTPYRPRPVTVHREQANEFGEPAKFLEIPVSWHLDDFPALDHVPGVLAGLMSTQTVFDRWKDNFDYAYQNEPDGCLVLTIHGLVTGRAHAIMLLDRILAHMAQHDGVWFATLSDIAAAWAD